MATPKEQLEGLKSSVLGFLDSSGEEILAEADAAVKELVDWLDYLESARKTGIADELLSGVRSALLEAIGALSLGLTRSALFAMRAQIDILLSWLYFRDHPVEWESVEYSGEPYRLPADVKKYLRQYWPGFAQRQNLLEKVDSTKDPYELLSAHIHGQNTSTIPHIGSLKEIVYPKQHVLEGVKVQELTASYLSGILLCCFAKESIDLPSSVHQNFKKRLGTKVPAFLKA